MSPFNFHESQAPSFHPVQECHLLIFMNLSLMFSARACTSPVTFHESQAQVFSHCEQFLPSFSPIPQHLGLHLFPPLHLPEQLSKLHWAFPQTCPEPTPKHTTKPKTPRFHLTHPCFELCRNSSPSYSAHCRKSVLNQCPKKKNTQNLRPQDFISHIPVLHSAGTALQVTACIAANLS